MDDSVSEKVDGEEDDLFLRLKGWFRADKDHSNEWRKEAEEDYDFVSGRQWPVEEEQVLKDQNRPPVVFNRVQPVIDVVCGQEVANRQEVRFIPRTIDDTTLNERMTEAARWFRDLSDAEDEDSDAFRDAVICGMGWSETRYDADEDPEGRPLTERVDPFEMYWDCHARRSNLVDARRIWRVKKMSHEEAKRLFPEADEALLNARWAMTDEHDDVHVNDRTKYDGKNDNEEDDDKQVTIVECQWHEMETLYLFPGPSGLIEATEEEALQIRAKYPDIVPKESKKRVFKRAFIGAKVLEEGLAPCPDHFSFNCITGKRDRNKGTWYGVVRPMKDPQRWANKWLSQTMHILNTNAKGGIFAENDAFEDKVQAQESYAKSDQITWVKKGALTAAKIQPKVGVPVPAGFFDLMNFAVSSVRDTSGVSVEMIGAQEANQAASLEYQRRQTSMTILSSLFDSLRRYRKLTGRVLLYIIQNDISPERMVRITSDNTPQYQAITPQAQSATYDIIVDDAPTSPNQKEQAWQIIQQMIPVVGQMMTPDMWIAALEYSPLPSSFAGKMKEAAEKAQANPQPDPETQKMQAEVQMKQLQMQMDTQQSQAEMAQKQQQSETDLMLQREKQQGEMELKRYQIDAEMALKREQLAAELDLKREQIAYEIQLKGELGLMNGAIKANSSSTVHMGGDPG